VAAPGADEQAVVDTAVREARLNLATAHLQANHPEKARPILEALHAAHPDVDRYLVVLAHCLAVAGDGAGSRELLEKRLARGALPEADLLLGIALFNEGRADEALVCLQRAGAGRPDEPSLHCQIGNVYLKGKHWPEAEQAFARTLALDADNAHAHHGLAIALLGLERYEEAAESALRAVGLLHFFPLAHFHLGVALVRLGWDDRAIQAFEVALAMQPGMVLAHRYLASLHRKHGDREQAVRHRKAAQALLACRRQGLAGPVT
jgi:tetratricopeptide (TPR) repeat protein